MLGYEDDQYDDNGYWSHDDGTEDQCKNVGPAYVVVRIIHGTPLPPVQYKPMDLVWQRGLDYNGAPLDPRWGWEVTHNDHPDAMQLCGGFHQGAPMGSPACTGQFTWLNTPSGWNAFICSFVGSSIHGHVNWSPATVEGKLHWGDHSNDDDDYNWELWPGTDGGLTAANPQTIHMEFDSDETVDNIGQGWWDQFHHAVDNSDAQARQMIGEVGGAYPDAIVIGLMGLDVEHSAPSELHPVFGMAIHVKDDLADDRWAIMGRNWGDEGYCAADEKETLESNTLSFLIPRANVAAVTTQEASFFSNKQGITMSVTRVPGGALVTFNLGPPAQGTLVSGLLRLSWTAAAPGPAHAGAIGTSAMALQASRFGRGGPVAQSESQRKAEVETHFKTLTSRLSSEERAAYLKPPIAPLSRVAFPVQVVKRAVPAKPTRVPQVRRVPDPRKAQRSLMRARVLCEAYKGEVPGVPRDACTQVMRQMVVPHRPIERPAHPRE